MRIFFSMITAAFLFFSASCTVRYYDTARLLNDYKTEGFLDRDHFQVSITGKPSPDTTGLVRQRESALKNAKIRMNFVVVDRLVEYSIDHQIKKLQIKDVKSIENLDEVRKELEAEFSKYLKYGRIAFEYYNEDYSAVIVYRIFKDDLIEDIESVKAKFNIKKDSGGEK